MIFVSDLFSNSISDNEIWHENGFYVLLKQLKEMGCIQDNDGIMADKGFRIEIGMTSDFCLNLKCLNFYFHMKGLKKGRKMVVKAC